MGADRADAGHRQFKIRLHSPGGHVTPETGAIRLIPVSGYSPDTGRQAKKKPAEAGCGLACAATHYPDDVIRGPFADSPSGVPLAGGENGPGSASSAEIDGVVIQGFHSLPLFSVLYLRSVGKKW